MQLDNHPLNIYHELDVGESIICTTKGDGRYTVELLGVDDKSVSVRVNDAVATIPLGHFAGRRIARPPGEVISVVELEGLRVGADITKAFMSGSNYSRGLLHLRKDARLLIKTTEGSFSPPGNHAFPAINFEWNYGEHWLQPVIYGWHLGIDLDGELGHPLAAVTDGTVLKIRHFDPTHEADDYWGNGLALLGDDGLVYIYMHWDHLTEGIEEGSRVKAGDEIGVMGRSGFDRLKIGTHLHFEVMVLRHPENYHFAFKLEPEIKPTPNRALPPEAKGYAVNPYPYLVEWYLNES